MNVSFSSMPFGSSYKFRFEQNDGPTSAKHQVEVDELAFRLNVPYQIELDENTDSNGNSRLIGTFGVHDNDDRFVENYCASRGIKFEKTGLLNRINQSEIIGRCVLADNEPEDRRMVLMDVEKFEELTSITRAKHVHSWADVAMYDAMGNVDACEDMYYRNSGSQLHKLLESSDEEIVVPELYINSKYSYMRPSFVFNRTGNDVPNESLYFAMKNIGMTKVPVAVDEHSYIQGVELGLFE